MSNNNLPGEFEHFADARRQVFLDVKNLKDAGKKVVRTFCSYFPAEIVLAAAAVLVSICSYSDETITEAEKDLPRNLCPLVKSSYGFAVTDKCPYMYIADLIVAKQLTMAGKFDFDESKPLLMTGRLSRSNVLVKAILQAIGFEVAAQLVNRKTHWIRRPA